MKEKSVNDHSRDRHDLNSVLPLEIPYSLTILASSFCNFKCKYCIHSQNNQNIKKIQETTPFLTTKVVGKLISDLKEKDEKLKRIILASYGEPLVNPDIAKIVKMLKVADVANEIVIVTNGTLLTHKLSDELIDAGLDLLRISIQGLSAEDYNRESSAKVDFEKLVDNIDYFYKNKVNTKMYIKVMQEQLVNENGKDEFYRIFGDKCDEIAIERLAPIIEHDVNNPGNNATINNNSLVKTDVCSTPFYSLHISTNGEVFSCCLIDNNTSFGNIMEDKFYNIWNSEQHIKFLIRFLIGKREYVKGCNTCVADKFTMRPEDIIVPNEELIEKYYNLIRGK